jgi:nitronate monooxygenase
VTRARALVDRLRLPVIAAPMFLVSGPALVIAASRAGVLGTFPALNQRSTEGFRAWLDEIEAGLSVGGTVPYGVNLIVHKTNPRVEADLRVCVENRVPAIITSLGVVPDLVKAVHGYGGVVLHDVINMRHAAKAIEAGVDGLVLVSAGRAGMPAPTTPSPSSPRCGRSFRRGSSRSRAPSPAAGMWRRRSRLERTSLTWARASSRQRRARRPKATSR